MSMRLHPADTAVNLSYMILLKEKVISILNLDSIVRSEKPQHFYAA